MVSAATAAARRTNRPTWFKSELDLIRELGSSMRLNSQSERVRLQLNELCERRGVANLGALIDPINSPTAADRISLLCFLSQLPLLSSSLLLKRFK